MEGSDHRLKGANAGGRARGGEPKQEGRGLRWRRAIGGGGEQSDVEGSELKWSNRRW